MNETGAVHLEAVAVYNYQNRSRCPGSDSYHRLHQVMLYTAKPYTTDGLYGYGICQNCQRPIRRVSQIGWIESVYIIIEWP